MCERELAESLEGEPAGSTRITFKASVAFKLQRIIAKRVREEKIPSNIRYVAGVDASYSSKLGIGIGVAVLYDIRLERVVEVKTVAVPVRIPYIPGLLAFRELPCIAAALSMLSVKPEVVLVDGHGLAHPRGAGLACHLGVALDVRSIGVAKKRLVGETVEMGGSTYLVFEGRVVGAVFREPPGSKPLYVSIGNRVTLEDAVELVRRTRKSKGLPEPLHLADRVSKEVRRRLG